MPRRCAVSPSKSNSMITTGSLPTTPAVMAWFDGDDLRRFVLDDAAIRVFDVDFAVREKSGVGVHAEIRADDVLHILRPAETGRVDHPFDARVAGPADIQPHVAEIAMRGAFHRREERIVFGGGCGRRLSRGRFLDR